MARQRLIRSLWFLLALLLAALVALLCWEPFLAEQPGPPPPPRAYAAEIIRDEWGVPHIHGRSDADVTFGVGWAHAEDDFATLQDVLAMTRCRYGALAGAEGAAVDYVCHLFAPRALVRRQYGALPADTRALLDGYASALNLYAARHPGEVRLARLFPVNGEDVATGFALRLPFFGGVDRQLKPLVEGSGFAHEYGPPMPGFAPLPFWQGGGDSQDAPNARPLPLPMGEAAADAGSNAFAVAPRRAGDGVTRLVSNTHQPWRGAVAWYEMEIRSDSGWHFEGASFPGSPYPFLGHNEVLGWTNTINRPDLADVYRLVLNKAGTHYRLDGQWLPLERERVWLPVRLGPLVLPVPRWIARARHGPVIENRNGAFALRYAGIDTIGALDEWYRLGKARNFAEWQAALSRMDIPSTNFTYADAAGNIGYFYNARIPARKPGFNWRGVLPGDRSDLIWQRPVAWTAIPKVINPASGYVFNANNTPFLAAGPGSELDPARTPPEMGVETDVTNRTRRAARMLAASPVLGRAELERIKYDTGYDNAGAVKAMLDGIAALDLSHEPELKHAQALLASWDFDADGKGPADTLAVMVLKEATSAAYNHRQPLPPREVLTRAAAHLMRWFGRLDVPLGTAQRLRLGRTDLPMDGGGDTLRAATSYDLSPTDGRLVVKHGDSFVLFVEWPRGGAVRSQSVVPFGAATTRPGSPHYTDQSRLFLARQLKPVRFTPQDVAAHAVTRRLIATP